VILLGAGSIVLFVIRQNRVEAVVSALQGMRAHIEFASSEAPLWARWLFKHQQTGTSHRVSAIEWPNGTGTDNMLFELSQLDGLTDLAGLRIARGEVTDKGLAHIKGLKSLKYLDLSGTQVSDAGISYLAEMKEMEGLNLSGTRVTDAGISQLKGLRNLKSLDVTKTRVTGAAVSELQRVLPDVHVEE
jgi:hypothetical protein